MASLDNIRTRVKLEEAEVLHVSECLNNDLIYDIY